MALSLNHTNHAALSPPPTANGVLSPDTTLEPTTPSAFDITVFRDYILSLLPPVLGASTEELESSLFDEDFDERVTKFAHESGAVVYVLKKKDDATEEAPPTYSYHLVSQLSYSPLHVSTLALIKRTSVLDSSIPLPPQLHLLNLFAGEESPYEGLHAMVSSAMKPWFEAFVGARGGSKDGDGKLGIPITKKKFAELELSLLHLQQNVEIPETHLIIHPTIQKVVEQARSSGQRPNISLLPSKTLTDSGFLNTLQNHVNQWIRAIQSVTRLNRDVSSGTASQEINFWLSMERALDGIDAQLKSDEVTMVLDCLRNAKRFRATVSFETDTGLKESKDLVTKYNHLMKDFPLDSLLSATDLDKINISLEEVINHLNKKLRLSPYPIRRALPLVEAISRDFNDQLLRLLTSYRLAYQPYDSFERILSQTQDIFRTWDDQIKEFTNVAREVTRRRAEKFIPIKINPSHSKLSERIRYLRDWRKQHEQLSVMTGPTKGLGGMGKRAGGLDMEEEVKEAYEIVKSIDVLDVSVEGSEIWAAAETAYNERVGRVENQIISRLRDRLGTARNANEMFRVFSKFNALFVRPKIRGAIQEYQTQLIESVKDDIKNLHDKFKTQYRYSDAYHMSQMRDFPPIAGAIIWARQIERQLLMYMKRVEDVLGKGWELYAEGQKLQSESGAFRKKLEPRQIFDAWMTDINRRDMGISGRLFEILKLRTGGYQLAVNFDPQVITLFKEVRNLLWLGFSIPHAVSNMAKEAKRVYPHAVSLMESVRTYGQSLELVESNPGIEWLVADYRNDVQSMISKGMNLKWDYFVNHYDTSRYIPGSETRDNRHIQFVKEFASVVSILQDKTNNLIDLYKDILRLVEEMSTCPYSTVAFAELTGKVQALVDRLSLEGYANLDHWVAELDRKIEAVFLTRLKHIIEVWCAEFVRSDDDSRRDHSARDMSSKKRADKLRDDKVLDGGLTLKPIVHEIRIQNQVIFLDPPLEYSRHHWIRQLHEWLGIICKLRRVQSSRYEIGLHMDTSPAADMTYTSLLLQLGGDSLDRPFSLIEVKVQHIKAYVAKWLQFQSLWDLESDYVFNRLGDSLAHWQQLLTEIKKARATFDTSDTQKSFGVCVIEYEQVQARVNAKYDAWQKEILVRFGAKLGAVMKELHSSILKARHDLEHQSIEGLATASRKV